jgi:hypothetical protein
MAESLSDSSEADDDPRELITGLYGKIKEFMADENNRSFFGLANRPQSDYTAPS